VAEALHDSAPADIAELVAALATEIKAVWSITPQAAVLTASSPRFATDPDAPGPGPSREGRDGQ